MPVGIAYLDGPRLARSMFAASEWVAAGREEINRINVFPVPDGDTGTNLSLTLRSVADALQALGDASLQETARTMARAAVLGARGNSGMMLANFLLGVSESLGTRHTATTLDLARALRVGYDRLYASLDEPREGTIITVARGMTEAAERVAGEVPDLATFVKRLYQEGEVALASTPELLSTLKEAGVVDAGGKGFVRMFEGMVRVIEGNPILPAALPLPAEDFSPASLAEVAEERDYQFCTEVVVLGEQLPPTNEVRNVMHRFGGSVVVVSTGDVLKAHVHTDTPEAVFTAAAQWGTVTSTKADDMRAQHRALKHIERRPVALVSDTALDLPDAIIDRHRIALVPLQITFGDRSFKDRVELHADQFYARLPSAKELPTTSQPAPADFVRVFRSALEEAEEVVTVLVSGVLSGTFQAGQTAARVAGLTRVRFVDSRTVSLGQGMLVLRGAELAESGWPASEIAEELERLKRQAGMFLTVDTYDNLLRSGRVSRGRAWLAGMLDVKPIIGMDEEGRLVPVDRARGREAVFRRVLSLLDQRLTPRPKLVRFGVAHASAPDVAERMRAALVAAFQPRDCLVAQATGVLGAHTGIGAWAVFYQIEDGAPTRPPGSVHG
jgi:DegV family protein with EDD domain